MPCTNISQLNYTSQDGKRAWFSVVGARHIWAWNPLSASSSPTKSPYNHHPEMNGTWRKVCALKHDNVDIDGHGEGNESTNHRVVSRWKQGRYLLIASTCGRLPLNAAANDSSSVLSSISIFDAVAEQVLPCVFDDTRAAASPSNITALAWCPRSLLFFAGDSDGTFLVYGAWMLKETAARGIGSNEKVAHRWLRVGRSKDVRWYRRSSLAIVRESSARRAITCMQFNDDGT